LATEFIKQSASITQKDISGRIAIDHLLSTYFKNLFLKKPQATALIPLVRHWKTLSPNSLTYETHNRQFKANSHSMVFFLIVLMRCLNEMHPGKAVFKKGKPDEKTIACFTMDDMVQYTEKIPDEILPPYRKNRQYINSVLSSNEVSRAEFPNCKLTFVRVERGVYLVDHNIKWL